ncbi:extensin-like domain-containing protein [Faunimonas sp. B44]|uniref:extensin-like domain-containing protein n=1 Tax=Faunimonas sp. B44 TaxID=3461493 RepID=UPI004044266D
MLRTRRILAFLVAAALFVPAATAQPVPAIPKPKPSAEGTGSATDNPEGNAPRARPGEADDPAAPDGTAAPAAAPAGPEAPPGNGPEPRPSDPAREEPTPGGGEPNGSSQAPAEGAGEPPAIDQAESDCRWRLKALGVAFEPLPAIDDGPDCRIPAPISVSELDAGLKLEPAATLSCPAAEALATWAKEVVVPAAREAFGTEPSEIVQASSYVCRTQNGEPGAKMSEHAAGNAVDILAIAVEGHGTIGLADPGAVVSDSAEGEAIAGFRARIRSQACAFFATVLGPGSDEAHATHLHLDIREREAGARICQ